MSLVNDMLRDLDKRNQLPAQARRVGSVISTADDVSKSYHPMLIALLVIVCLMAGVGGGYVFFNNNDVDVLDVVKTENVLVSSIVEETGNKLDVSEISITDSGFILEISASKEFLYSVKDRGPNGLILQIDNVDSYSRVGSALKGFSVMQTSKETFLEFELNRQTDFQINRDYDGDDFVVVISGVYRALANVSSSEPEVERQVEDAVAREDQAQIRLAVEAPVDNFVPAASSARVNSQQELAQVKPETQRAAPIRINRAMTFEQQDRSVSQASISLMQSGRLTEAYEKLLTFLGANPEAHNSRETLGTILIAQNELLQANVIVDEGLRLAPNYAPYKKTKARLLMQEGELDRALQILKALPPKIANDTEYFEIMAGLYRQNNQHDMAIATYQELLRINREKGDWWAGLAISLDAQGDKSKAIASYQQALLSNALPASVRQYSQSRIQELGVQ